MLLNCSVIWSADQLAFVILFLFQKRDVEMLDLRALKIYVDGACPRNVGGPGGFAAWREFPFDWGKPD